MFYQAHCKLDSMNRHGAYITTYVPGGVDPKYFVNGITSASIQLDDSRRISAAQRGLIYSLFNDIRTWEGRGHKRIGIEEIKAFMKARFCLQAKHQAFSLSNVSMTVAGEFIDYLLDFCFERDIDLTLKPFEISRTVRNYLYLCFKHRKCAICNKSNAVVHHLDTVGIGMNRNRVDHSKKLLIMVCSNHHSEAHNIGDETFCNKYHVAGIFVDVATLKALNIKGEYGEEANV